MNAEALMRLNTEQRNPDTMNIDRCSVEEILRKINAQDQKVPLVIEAQIPAITKLVEAADETVANGGRIFYIGAGTSGRMGILDASECPPTYGVSPDLFQGVIAGGMPAILKAQEGAEDSKEGAVKDLQNLGFTAKDMLIGLAASGRTPYVLGALEYASSLGAQTGSIACVDQAEISKAARYPVEVVTGPEVVTGSTRMKAGTAQKLVLNMISTTVMIRRGKVYENLMVDVQPTNSKLETRAKNMIAQLTGLDEAACEKLYLESHRQVKTAMIMHLLHTDYEEARKILEAADGRIAQALENEKRDA